MIALLFSGRLNLTPGARPIFLLYQIFVNILNFLSDNIACTFAAELDGDLIASSSCVSLTVLGSPHVTLSIYKVILVENTTLNLICEADVPDTGHPDWQKGVNFKWTERGTEVVTNGGELTNK